MKPWRVAGAFAVWAFLSGFVCADSFGSTSLVGSSLPPPSQAVEGRLSVISRMTLGDVFLGTSLTYFSVTITNIGTASVALYGIESDRVPEFRVVGSTCGNSIPIAGVCSFAVEFSPADVGYRSATVTITSSGAGSPDTVQVQGNGVQPPPVVPPIQSPPTPIGIGNITLVEYYDADFDHYFITGLAAEVNALDGNAFPGWTRTIYMFTAYPAGTAGKSNVCRFFSASFASRSSHFYSASPDECQYVKDDNPDWTYEGDVFAIDIPKADGSCLPGTVPVYRLYNNGEGGAPNHRYTTELAVRAQMIARGWIAEGYGLLGVVMCSP